VEQEGFVVALFLRQKRLVRIHDLDTTSKDGVFRACQMSGGPNLKAASTFSGKAAHFVGA
jgi:hypothetical protein